MPRPGAVSRIYAQLRPLRNVRALLPPSRSSGGARAPQNSVQSAAARAAPREGCGGGADECLDWCMLLLAHKARVLQKTRGKLILEARGVANARAYSNVWKRSAPDANSPALLTKESLRLPRLRLDWQTGKWS